MQYKDNDIDGIIDSSERVGVRARSYAAGLTTQFKKGLLSYCVLLACEQATYTSEIISRLNLAELDVAEGTVYPLLTRLRKDGLLDHTWQENPQGPPRKYYFITDYGRAVREIFAQTVEVFNEATKTLERSIK